MTIILSSARTLLQRKRMFKIVHTVALKILEKNVPVKSNYNKKFTIYNFIECKFELKTKIKLKIQTIN